MSIIYLVTNSINGKRYVGKTRVSLTARWKRHVSCARTCASTLITRAIMRHGADAFTLTTLEEASDEALSDRERHWIAALNTNACRGGHGYNMTDGGEGSMGRLVTLETRRKLSLSSRGRRCTAEQRLRISQAKRGRSLSTEHKNKLSAVLMGRKKTLETRRRMGQAALGRQHTPESRVKMSRSHTGKRHSALTKLKLSFLNRGRRHTVESKQLMSERQHAVKRSIEQLAGDGALIEQFDSLSAAVRCLRVKHGFKKAAVTPLTYAASGRTQSAYGFRWRWMQ